MIQPGERFTPELLTKAEAVFNYPDNEIEYLGVDPGNKNGICGYNKHYHIQFMMTVLEEDVINFLNCFHNVKTCVIENFTLFPHKAKEQSYSDMTTSRVIGRFESWASLKGVQLVKQASKIKPTGYAWIGQKPLPKSNPRNHELDAHVHFMYWGVKNGKINAADLLKKVPE